MFSERELKTRIAIWIHGGVGSGIASQGQPVIMRLIQWLATQFEVDVYTLHPPNDDFSPPGFSIYSVKHKQSNLRGWLHLISTFRKNNRSRTYDCLYAFWGYPSGVVAFFLGLWFGRGAILHLQGGDAVGLMKPPYGIFRHRLRGMLCRYVYNHCSRLIALTEFQKDFLIKNGVRRSINVIPYGVDEKLFSFRAKSDSENGYTLLHVGNLTPVKGQEMLLKAFSIISSQINARLVIVGPDYDDGFLKDLVMTLNIHDKVKFAGHQLYHDLPFFYHGAHVLIHTSVYEGQAVVLAEAASCGTMLAGTKVGMLADMNDECAIRVDYGDHEKLASQILSSLRSPGQMQMYIRSAKAWVHQRDEQFTFQAIKKVIDETVTKH